MRATRLDGCGRPVYGPASMVATDGFVSVALTAQTEESESVTVTNAAGRVVVREAARTSLVGYTAEIVFTSVDPALFAMLTGQATVIDEVSGDAVGFRVNSDVDPLDSGFALEVWTGVPSVRCSDDEASQGTFGYLLLPFLQGGTFGDFTIENGAVSFSVSGATTTTGSGWGVGPYDVLLGPASTPGPLAEPIGVSDHLHVQVVEIAPPESACGVFPLLDPTDSAITSITAVDDLLEVTFTAVPTGATEPVFWDFGDGTWGYSDTDDAGVIVHTYEAAGTYTVSGTRGGATVTDEVVVTAS